MVNGEWLFSEWSMVNGENSNILLFLNQNANPMSTLSVFSYPLFSYPLSGCSFKFAPFASAAGARSPPTPSAVVNPDGG